MRERGLVSIMVSKILQYSPCWSSFRSRLHAIDPFLLSPRSSSARPLMTWKACFTLCVCHACMRTTIAYPLPQKARKSRGVGGNEDAGSAAVNSRTSVGGAPRALPLESRARTSWPPRRGLAHRPPRLGVQQEPHPYPRQGRMLSVLGRGAVRRPGSQSQSSGVRAFPSRPRRLSRAGTPVVGESEVQLAFETLCSRRTPLPALAPQSSMIPRRPARAYHPRIARVLGPAKTGCRRSGGADRPPPGPPEARSWPPCTPILFARSNQPPTSSGEPYRQNGLIQVTSMLQLYRSVLQNTKSQRWCTCLARRHLWDVGCGRGRGSSTAGRGLADLWERPRVLLQHRRGL